MLEISKEEFEAFAEQEFPGKAICYTDNYCFIQAGNILGDSLHYELLNHQIHLHIEGPNWREIRDYLKQKKIASTEVYSSHWNRKDCQWTLINFNIKNEEDVKEGFCRIRGFFEPIILDFEKGESKVIFETKCLNEILHLDLNIPDYQRIYCWDKEQVIALLDDILSIKTSSYYLGNIILHTNKGKFDIVDGQQRLVTLAIVLHKLNENIKLLKCVYESSEAQSKIYRNSLVIDNYLKSHDNEKLKNNILNKLSFGVLTIDSQHLDLAFTFFNNTNSRGKPLTDYDLLKPHHLRYIPSDYESQQELLATQWDKMINLGKSFADNPENPESRRDADYIHVLELYLYRLRKWSRHNSCDEFDRYIYSEYKSAPIIEEIPPFGEKFDYYEPIQGGQHFFEFVEHFMQKYREFAVMHEIDGDGKSIDNVMDILCSNFTGYSDKWYRYVIEALTFCYFLKFGTQYISEASLSITRYISQIRFTKGRAYEPTIVNYAKESGITLMIDQATSPTFFLAEIENKIKNLDGIPNLSGVREDYFNKCKNVSESLQKKCISISFNDYFATRYERITSK